MASYERSEIMFAVAMHYTVKQLTDLIGPKSDTDDLVAEIPKFKKIAQGKSIAYGSSNIQKGFVGLIDTSDKSINDMVKGITAALAFKKFLPSGVADSSPKAYMTGDIWPKEVEPFSISAYGFSSYNSSDVIVTYNNVEYYGVSLKKKPTDRSADPTIINKVFDSILNARRENTGKAMPKVSSAKTPKQANDKNAEIFGIIRAQLQEAKGNYFAGLVQQAISKGIFDAKDVVGYTKTLKGDRKIEVLYESAGRNKKLFPDAYINTKGWKKAPKSVWEDPTKTGTPYDVIKSALKDPNSMRYFVNNELGKRNNELWSEYLKIMNDHAETFANTLLNLVLKTMLYEELTIDKLNSKDFSFFLVTGTGTANLKTKKISVTPGQVVPLKTILCGLTRFKKKYASFKYEMILDEKKKEATLARSRTNTSDDVDSEESGAAKIYFTLQRGGITILDLELRYKGTFTAQPQFFATINQEFKDFLKKECKLKV